MRSSPTFDRKTLLLVFVVGAAVGGLISVLGSTYATASAKSYGTSKLHSAGLIARTQEMSIHERMLRIESDLRPWGAQCSTKANGSLILVTFTKPPPAITRVLLETQSDRGDE